MSEFLDRRAFALIAKSKGKVFAQSFYDSVSTEHATSMTKRRLIRQVGNFVEMTNDGKMEMLRSLTAKSRKRTAEPVVNA